MPRLLLITLITLLTTTALAGPEAGQQRPNRGTAPT
jgi:hypothetical protein